MRRQNRSRRDVLLASAAGAMTLASGGLQAGQDEHGEHRHDEHSAHGEHTTRKATGAIRYKVSVAGYSFRDMLDKPGKPGKMSLQDMVDLAVKIGLDAIEPTSYYFLRDDDAFIYDLKRKAFLSGIEISGTPVGNNFCLPPGAKLDAQIAHVRKWVDICVKLGSPAIRIFAGRPNKEMSRDQTFDATVKAMREATEYAGGKGVFLAIENHGYLTETADDLLKLLEAVDNDWLGVNLDTGNFHGDGYGNIAKAAPHAVTCQVKTMLHNSETGKREQADFGRIMDILREANYRGYITLEYEGGKPVQEVPEYIRKLKALA